MLEDDVLGRRDLNLCLGDIHIGKSYDTGLSSYDPDEAMERIRTYLDKLFAHPMLPKYDKINVHALGDNIDGRKNYKHHAAVTTMPIADQQEFLVDALEWFLRDTARRTRKSIGDNPIDVYCKEGNHGTQDKTAHPKDNAEITAYRLLKERMGRTRSNANPIRVHMVPPSGLVRVAGATLYISHRGFNPALTPAHARKAGDALVYRKADIALHGHYHHAVIQPLQHDKMIIANGALHGPDPFVAEEIHKYDPGRQVFFLTESGKGYMGGSYIEWVD